MVAPTRLYLQGPLVQTGDTVRVKQPCHLAYLKFLLRLRGMLEEDVGELEAWPDLGRDAQPELSTWISPGSFRLKR